MPRKRTTKDFAIPMDEFHPKPSIAAAFADRKANDSALEHLATDAKRVEDKLRALDSDSTERRRLEEERNRITALIVQCRADRVEIDRIIEEAKVA
jgi:flagellar motility protein MotE (MotC chaperone)